MIHPQPPTLERATPPHVAAHLLAPLLARVAAHSGPTVVTLALPATSLEDVFAAAHDLPGVFWAGRDDEDALVALGSSLAQAPTRAEPPTVIGLDLDERSRAQALALPGRTWHLRGFADDRPAIRLTPRWTFARGGGRTVVHLWVDGPEAELPWATELATLLSARAPSRDGQARVVRCDDALARPRYEQLITQARAAIRHGDLHKVVLGRRQRLEFAHPIDVAATLRALASQEPACTRFAVRAEAKAEIWLGATPERLLGVRAGEIRCDALAGTRAGRSAADRDALLASAKDVGEHAPVVRAIAEVLRAHGDQVTWTPSPAAHELGHLTHLRSEVRAQLRPATSALAIAEAMHPTPAVGGDPRPQALALRATLEPESRGYYTGYVGWTDGVGDADFAVVLRCAAVAGPRADLWAGGGIVADSDPAAEWDETVTKLGAMRRALGAQP